MMLNKGITKDQSSMLYGIAILFMLFHHLFLDYSTGLYISVWGGGRRKNCMVL